MAKRTTLGSEFADIFKKAKENIAASMPPPTPAAAPASQQVLPKGAQEKQGRAESLRTHGGQNQKKKRKKFWKDNRHGDLSVYSTKSAKPVAPAAPKPELSLHEVSADMRRLVIRAPDAKSFRRMCQPAQVGDTSEQAILGLDFGTAYTKAVISWRRRHYVVDWSNAVSCEDRHLLPSIFSRSASGEAALGTVEGWRRVDGIKMKLLTGGSNLAPAAEMDAVTFLAFVIQYARDWFAPIAREQRAAVPAWRLNIGLPAVPWQDQGMRRTWSRVAACAWRLSEESISAASALKAFKALERDERIGVVPEFAAQVATYLRSPQRQADLHGLLDVGAGTIDVIAFNAHWDSNGDVLPIFAADVRPLGSHHLIGALAGAAGQDKSWRDSDALLDDGEIAAKTLEQADGVSVRRAIFERELKAAVNHIVGLAKRRYRESRVWESRSGLPFFLCGGGSSNPRFERLVAANDRFKLSLRKLPCPDAVVGAVDDTNFHRVSVAYGLSHLLRNISRIVASDDIPPDPPPRVIELRDRDEDR